MNTVIFAKRHGFAVIFRVFAISHEWLQKYLISTECNLQLISQFKHKKSFSINLLLHISRTLLLTQQSACMCLFRDHKDTVVSFMYVAAFQLMFILLFIFSVSFQPTDKPNKRKIHTNTLFHLGFVGAISSPR